MPSRPRPSPRGEKLTGILPQIPPLGIASRLTTNELVNAFDACQSDRSQGSPRKGVLHRNALQVGKVDTNIRTVSTLQTRLENVQSARGLASQKVRDQEVVSQKTCKALYQYDNVHFLSHLREQNSDFDGHDPDEAVNDSAGGITVAVSDFLSTDRLEKARCSLPMVRVPTSTDHVQEDDAGSRRTSLRSLLSSRLQSKERGRSKEKKLPRNRINSLRSSFKHTRAEIEQQLNNMELALGNDARTLHELDNMDSPLEAYPDAEYVQATYDWSQIETSQIKPPAVMPFVEDKDAGTIPLRSERKELLLCTAQLNFYRWLCGLRPAMLVKPCLSMCEIISEALLPRSHMGTANGAQQVKLGEVLSSYIAGDDVNDGVRAVVMHGDGSLVSAIEQSVIGCSPQRAQQCDEEAFEPSRALLARELARAVAIRGEEYGGKSKKDKRAMLAAQSKNRLPGHLFDKPPYVFSELPAKLEPFRIFWELQEQECPRREAQLCNKTHSRHDSSKAMGRTPGHGFERRLPEINLVRTPRMRTEVCLEALPRNHRGAHPSAQNAGKVSAFWGDQAGSLNFRRFLLNPALRVFGASRQQDTCVLWTGNLGRYLGPVVNPDVDIQDTTAKSDRSSRKQAPEPQNNPNAIVPEAVIEMDSEAVCFPPPGFVPLEILNDAPRVQWTIMPDSRRYQPTEKVRVQIWRVNLQMRWDDHKRARIAGHNHPRDNDWTAERLEEVPVSQLKIDCSSMGNPFCIIFRPELAQLKDGDEFEVLLSGLCGAHQELTFFHHFCALRQPRIDHHLMGEVSQLRTLLTNPTLWREARTFVPNKQDQPDGKYNSEREDSAEPGPRADAHTNSRKSKFGSDKALETRLEQTPNEVHQTMAGPISMAQIGLVSHSNLEIHTDSIDLIIMLHCERLTAIVPELYLARVSGNEEVPRGTQVHRLGDEFVVRVKMPMSPARYELHFLVSPLCAPETAILHPLKYTIVTSDACSNLLASLQHPWLQKFGYAPVLPTAQFHRISVIAPLTYRVCIGPAYFLLHAPELVPQGSHRHPSEGQDGSVPNHSSRTSSKELAQSALDTNAGAGSSLFTRRLRRYGLGASQPGAGPGRQKPQMLNWASDLHDALAKTMTDFCQDSIGDVHLDASIGGRYVLRLKQRHDFPELFEGLMNFAEADSGSRVEIFLRRPRTKGEDYAPQKLAEWIICLPEVFPIGF